MRKIDKPATCDVRAGIKICMSQVVLVDAMKKVMHTKYVAAYRKGAQLLTCNSAVMALAWC